MKREIYELLIINISNIECLIKNFNNLEGYKKLTAERMLTDIYIDLSNFLKKHFPQKEIK